MRRLRGALLILASIVGSQTAFVPMVEQSLCCATTDASKHCRVAFEDCVVLLLILASVVVFRIAVILMVEAAESVSCSN